MHDTPDNSPVHESIRLAVATIVAVAGTGMLAAGWSESSIQGDGPGRAVLLALPWLVASVLQSSTAALLLVGAGAAAGCLSVGEVFSGVVGCNLGAAASATATGLGHVRQDAVFRRVLAATVADLALTFPVGLGFLLVDIGDGWGARMVAEANAFMGAGAHSSTALANAYLDFLEFGLALPQEAVVAVMMAAGSVLTLAAVQAAQVALLRLGGARRELELNHMLDRPTGFSTGLMLGAMTQSAGRTMSVLAPLTASGVLDLQKSLSVSRAASVGAVLLPTLITLLIGAPGVAIVHIVFAVTALGLCLIPRLRNLAALSARSVVQRTSNHPRTGFAALFSIAIGIPLLILGLA